MTLKYTRDQARERFVDAIAIRGIPAPWWPASTGNDCVGFATERLGLRRPADFSPHFISIAAFRRHFGFNEVPISELGAGMLVVSNWHGGQTPEHLEYVYSVDHDDRGQAVIIGANTGPRAGVPLPRGVWQKARPLDGHLLFGIEIPYKQSKPPRPRRKVVKTVAVFLNETVPNGPARTGADKSGDDGPNYWRLVQTWGRTRGLYGPTYKIDGVPGPRTRVVEQAAYVAATKKQ